MGKGQRHFGGMFDWTYKNDTLVTAWSNMVHIFIHEIRTLSIYTHDTCHICDMLLYYNGKIKLQVHTLHVITAVPVYAHCMQVTNCGLYDLESLTKYNFKLNALLFALCSTHMQKLL